MMDALFPFTVEEENLICIYDISSRTALISSIKEAIPHYDDEPEMQEIATSAIRKLEAMTDADFSTIILHPAYHGEDGEESEG